MMEPQLHLYVLSGSMKIFFMEPLLQVVDSAVP